MQNPAGLCERVGRDLGLGGDFAKHSSSLQHLLLASHVENVVENVLISEILQRHPGPSEVLW